MDDMMEATVDTGTTPAAEAESTEQSVDTPADDTATDAAEDTTPAAEAEVETAQQTESAEETFAVTYNHEAKAIPIKEAQRYVQHYMHLTKEGGVMDTLYELADARGVDIETMVKGLAETSDRILKEQLLEQAGGNQDIADRLYELEVTKRRAAHDAAKGKRATEAQQEQASINERLATEFAGMKGDFGLASFHDVPKEAISMAVSEGINLRDAYLRHQWTEHKRMERNAAQQASASKATAGSQADPTPEEPMDANAKALIAGLRSVLNR